MSKPISVRFYSSSEWVETSVAATTIPVTPAGEVPLTAANDAKDEDVEMTDVVYCHCKWVCGSVDLGGK